MNESESRYVRLGLDGGFAICRVGGRVIGRLSNSNIGGGMLCTECHSSRYRYRCLKLTSSVADAAAW